MNRRWATGWFIATLFLSGVALAVVSDRLPLATPARIATALAFLSLVPGMGWMAALGLRPVWRTLSLAVAVSLALGVLTSVAMGLSSSWSPVRAVAGLVVVGMAGAFAWLARAWRERSRAEP